MLCFHNDRRERFVNQLNAFRIIDVFIQGGEIWIHQVAQPDRRNQARGLDRAKKIIPTILQRGGYQ